MAKITTITCPHCGNTWEVGWRSGVEIDIKLLRKLRLEKGLLQRELAAAIGYSANAITQYEVGNQKPPLRTLEAIAAVLGCDATTLMAQGE